MLSRVRNTHSANTAPTAGFSVKPPPGSNTDPIFQSIRMAADPQTPHSAIPVRRAFRAETDNALRRNAFHNHNPAIANADNDAGPLYKSDIADNNCRRSLPGSLAPGSNLPAWDPANWTYNQLNKTFPDARRSGR